LRCCGSPLAWLATGLYIAPAISGYEPKFQKPANVLFYALLFIVVGSTAMDGWAACNIKAMNSHSGSVIRVWNSQHGTRLANSVIYRLTALGDFARPWIITCTQNASESRGLIAMVFWRPCVSAVFTRHR
jgi:nitric oxide reductase subunit B